MPQADMISNLPLAYHRNAKHSYQWHPHHPHLQLAWDATSFKAFGYCPRYYYYTVIRGFKSYSESFHLQFGRLYHSALETYDEAIALGVSHSDARLLTTDKVLKESFGWESGDNTKNRFTLWRSIAFYMEQFPPETDPVKTVVLNNIPVIELNFSFNLDRSRDGYSFFITGYFDGLVEFANSYYVRERKTTKRQLNSDWFNSFSPDIQIDIYTIAGEVVLNEPTSGVYVDGAQIGVNFTRFARGPVPRSPDAIAEFFQDVQSTLDRVESYADERYYPKNTRNCWSCHFAKICRLNPSMREVVLNAEFRVEDWDPTLARTEV